VSDVYAPVSGEVINVNGELENAPDLINSDAFGKGWIAKLKLENPAEMTNLLGAADYEGLIKEEKH
jgi:glycine cleavage system H protein